MNSRLATEYGAIVWPSLTLGPVLRATNSHQAGILVERCVSSLVSKGSGRMLSLLLESCRELDELAPY